MLHKYLHIQLMFDLGRFSIFWFPAITLWDSIVYPSDFTRLFSLASLKVSLVNNNFKGQRKLLAIAIIGPASDFVRSNAKLIFYPRAVKRNTSLLFEVINLQLPVAIFDDIRMFKVTIDHCLLLDIGFHTVLIFDSGIWLPFTNSTLTWYVWEVKIWLLHDLFTLLLSFCD